MVPSFSFHGRLRLEALARFADSMATCLAAGLSPVRLLQLSGTVVADRSFHRIAVEAARACDEGFPVSEALKPAARYFPSFFLPLIAAGELCGRQVESFRDEERAAALALAELETSLELFNHFLLRAVSLSVAMSIAGTIWLCLADSGR